MNMESRVGQANSRVAGGKVYQPILQWLIDLQHFWHYPRSEWKAKYWLRKELRLD